MPTLEGAKAGNLHLAPSLSTATVLSVAAVVAWLATIGGDARWVGALGRHIVEARGLPDGVPFAVRPSEGWPNPSVLAQLLFAGAGDRGLQVLQVLAVGSALLITSRSARRAGAGDAGIALVLAAVAVGAAAPLLVVRVQLFSLPLFALVVALLRSEDGVAGRRHWWLCALLAVWSNLHGAVLVGLAVTAVHLLAGAGPRDPLRRLAAVATCAGAVCVTPALLRTPEYFWGVLRSVTVERRTGLWERLDLGSPIDTLLVLVAASLLVCCRYIRLPLWEWLVIAGLCVGTALGARNGVWLLLFLAQPAARGLSGRVTGPARSTRPPRLVLLAAAAAAIVLAGIGVARGPQLAGASAAVLEATASAAGGTPVAAEGVLAEQLVAEGGCVWISNPLDAFSRSDQARFLDWEASGRLALLPAGTSVVLARRPGAPYDVLSQNPAWRQVAADGRAALFVRDTTYTGARCGNRPAY